MTQNHSGDRPEQYRFHNGSKAVLPFGAEEYEDRVAGLRDIMEMHGLDAVVLTSMQIGRAHV